MRNSHGALGILIIVKTWGIRIIMKVFLFRVVFFFFLFRLDVIFFKSLKLQHHLASYPAGFYKGANKGFEIY